MNKPLPQQPVLPQPPDPPTKLAMSPELRGWLNGVTKWCRDFYRAVQDDLTGVHDQINTGVQGVGDTLASAATITPDHPIHQVSGTAAISTITVPTGFSGPVFLIPQGAWTLVTGGNIGLASTAAVGRVLMVVYDYNAHLWYPAY